jgi:hypothetical protein
MFLNYDINEVDVSYLNVFLCLYICHYITMCPVATHGHLTSYLIIRKLEWGNQRIAARTAQVVCSPDEADRVGTRGDGLDRVMGGEERRPAKAAAVGVGVRVTRLVRVG